MKREQISEKLRTILVRDFGVTATAVTAAATFRETFQMDSMDVVDFVMLIEREFGYKRALADYRKVACFDDLVAFVESVVTRVAEPVR